MRNIYNILFLYIIVLSVLPMAFTNSALLAVEAPSSGVQAKAETVARESIAAAEEKRQDALLETKKRIAEIESEANDKIGKIQAEADEAINRLNTIDRYYTTGASLYQKGAYQEAIKSFEGALEMDPGYEAAELYLEACRVQLDIIEKRKRLADRRIEIEGIKLKMADIISEYDNRVKMVDALAIKYFLEQAFKSCQVGDYQSAQKYYNLCYKVSPYSKEKIEWFVKSTHDLVRLTQALEEANSEIEELSAYDS